jgi:hypothetical protein
MMSETERAWERLLDYRERVRGWMGNDVSLADTRLRVARLLDGGFGYGWDDLEADFQAMGHRADFALAVDGRRWGAVLVRAMGSGTGDGPPPEAYVLADGAGLCWTWVTDGTALTVFHVGPDLVARPVVALDLIRDDEARLRRSWDVICRDGVAAGRLEQHRLSLLRPTPADIRQALSSPPVLAALQQVLARSFPNPGSADDLADGLADLLDGDWEMAPELPPTAGSPLALPAPPLADAPPAIAHPSRDANVQAAPLAMTDDGQGPCPSADGADRHAPPAAVSMGQPEPLHLPAMDLAPVAPDEPAPAATSDRPASPPPLRRQDPPSHTLLTAMEKQRQTHERLRQNLLELKENRARLQDALSEMQKDYPERFERPQAPREAEAVGAGAKPASWTLLGHLQAMGNGYWEWCAADNGGPGVRLN